MKDNFISNMIERLFLILFVCEYIIKNNVGKSTSNLRKMPLKLFAYTIK